MNRNSILIFYKLSFLIKLIILKYYLFVLLLNNFLFHLFCNFFKIIIIQDNQYISVSKIDEVISASSLAYALPKDGPRLIEIITAQADQKFLQLMKESAIYTRFKTDNFIQKQKDNTLAEKIINFINNRAIQFNSRERFYNCEI